MADAHPLGSGVPNALDQAARDVKEAALKVLEEKMSHLSRKDSQCAIDAIRQLVIRDVDQKVCEKTEELWQKGAKALTDMQKKHKDQTAHLADEVEKCRDRQRALQAENQKLKQEISNLANRFSLLGAVCGGKNATVPQDLAAVANADAATATPQSEKASPETLPQTPFSPDLASGICLGEACETSTASLPDVPSFPFLAQMQSPCPGFPATASPLCLADALGTQTPTRTPLSLAMTLSPCLSPDTHLPCVEKGRFTFTLRKADGADLGLNVSHHEDGTALRVESVRPDGAVEAWNRQCAGTAAQEKVVVIGDNIIAVNGIGGDPKKMLDECRDKQLLRITVARGPLKSTALRADASVFVPMSARILSQHTETENMSADPPDNIDNSNHSV